MRRKALKLGSSFLRISPYLVAEHNGFSDFLHGLAFLAALALQGKVGLFFVETEVALQNAFGALDNLAGLQLFGESGVCILKASKFDFRSDEKADGGDHTDFAPAINMMLA